MLELQGKHSEKNIPLSSVIEIFFTGQLDPGGDSSARSIHMKKFEKFGSMLRHEANEMARNVAYRPEKLVIVQSCHP